MTTASLFIKTLESGTKVYVAGCVVCNMPPKNNLGDFLGRCEHCTEKVGA
jgi:hypothetical protein